MLDFIVFRAKALMAVESQSQKIEEYVGEENCIPAMRLDRREQQGQRFPV